MQLVARGSAIVFGVTMLTLSIVIAFETIVRKLFSYSLGGVDELSGYAIALSAPLAFTVALIQRSHIRINLLLMRMTLRMQAVLNALASVTLAVLAAYLLAFTVRTVRDTQLYGSIAQTPWATPLIYPQLLWLIAMAVFAGAAGAFAARSLRLLARGDWAELNIEFRPPTVTDELKSEIGDLRERS